jgi:hypothetical protein
MTVELNEYLANNKEKIDEIEKEHRKIRELIAVLDKNKNIFTLDQVTRFSEGISKASKVINDKIEKYKKDLKAIDSNFYEQISDLMILSQDLPGATTEDNPSPDIFEPIRLKRSDSNDSNDSYNFLGLDPRAPESPNTKKIMKEVKKQYENYLEENEKESGILQNIGKPTPKKVPSKAKKLELKRKGGKKTKSKKSKSKKNKTKKKNRKSKSKK